MDRLKRVADSLGLPFVDRTHTYNTRLAQELGAWATCLGCGEAFHQTAFHATFAEAKNIARIPVLLDLAARVGLPREGASETLRDRRFCAEVDKDWALARELGITAVPTLVMDGRRLVGAQPYEAMEKWVRAGGGGPLGGPG